nr:NERD domain-containing protein [Desulfobacula sp.]
MKLLIIAQIVPILSFLGIMYLVLFAYRQYNLRKKSRTPFTEKALLRLPGHSLDIKIRDIDERLIINLFAMIFTPTIFVNIIIISALVAKMEINFSNFGITFIGAGVMIIFFIYKTVTCLFIRQNLRLGYFGELVTAEELNKLMPEGNHVFHDFQADYFNIDHIVVGPAGVFAIETKARSKAVSGDNKKDATATYNGREIVFSNFNDTKYLDQAKRQAKWLSNWLKSAVGEPVEVFPIISLPGFYVERTAPYDGMFVINPKQMKTIIRSKTVKTLDESKIQRIVHQLDQKCRDLEIISKQYDANPSPVSG